MVNDIKYILRFKLSIEEKMLSLLAVVLPWSNAISNILIGILIFISLKNSFQESFYVDKEKRAGIGLLFVFVVFSVISISYSYDVAQSYKYLARLSLLFVIPFVILLGERRYEKEKLNYILALFLHSVFVLAVLTLLFAVIKWINTDNIDNIWSFITYTNLSTRIINHQPIYFSLYIGFALIIGSNKLLNKKRKGNINLLLIEIFFLFLFLFLLGARTAIFATFVCMMILFVLKSKKKFFIFIFFGVLLFSINYSFNESFKKRIDYLLEFKKEFDYSSSWSYEGLALRMMTWDCSIDIIKDNFWFGTGIGGAQNLLDECYVNKSYESLVYFKKTNGTSFNSHSLLLDVFLRTGVLGFTVIFFMFIFFLFHSYKTKNIVLFIFLLFFLLNGITDSLFVREKGIVFFAFFLGVTSCIRIEK